MANTNRQVANILKNNSENTLNSAPRITIWQTGMNFRKEHVQYPGLVESIQVVERLTDPATGAYTGARGNASTVQRMMPRPFEMEIQVDIWTTNMYQKYQLIEQIFPVIAPSVDIQNSQNALDWTALTTFYLEDINFSSRSIPIGGDSEIDICTLKLRLPMWLSPPAKVTAQNVIQQIIANVLGSDANLAGYGSATGTQLTQAIVTPGDHYISVSGGKVTLLSPDGGDGTAYSWQDYLNLYGIYKPAVSEIHLYYTDDFENGPFVTGTIQLSQNATNELLLQVNPGSLPANTLPAFTAMINPLKTFPGNGLPVAATGQRYLIAADIGPSQAWGNITAYANDIIEYVNGAWIVAFASKTVSTNAFVLNNYSGSQLKWTGSDWAMSVETIYAPGYWRLKL
ncbi:unnamed protein product [Sphagnum tenellum]